MAPPVPPAAPLPFEAGEKAPHDTTTKQLETFRDMPHRNDSVNSFQQPSRPPGSPKFHDASEVPPTLPPLNAFATHSSLLAKKLEDSKKSPRPLATLLQRQPVTRRPSVSSFQFQEVAYSGNDWSKEKQRCPYPDCGNNFKDLKAHMLTTHQVDRPEKCPVAACHYHTKGFAHKYDRNRHALTHYKGTMVCGFCPGSGSAAEKSFNRTDVFKRHLVAVHGVEQTPLNSRKKKSASMNSGKKRTGCAPGATGKCLTCSSTFSNAQDFYDHLDDCVLRIIDQEEPAEAVNARHLADQAALETLKDPLSKVCGYCDEAFKASPELEEHKLRHTKPFKCEVAGCTPTEGFSSHNDLARHRKVAHPREYGDNDPSIPADGVLAGKPGDTSAMDGSSRSFNMSVFPLYPDLAGLEDLDPSLNLLPWSNDDGLLGNDGHPLRTETARERLEWYATDDGPWVPMYLDGGDNSMFANGVVVQNNDPLFVNPYSENSAPERDTEPYGIMPYDSGYGSTSTPSVWDQQPFPTLSSMLTASNELDPLYAKNDDPWIPKHPSGDNNSIPANGAASGTFPFVWDSGYGAPYIPPILQPPFQATDGKEMVCEYCNKVVKSNSELKKHKQRHTKPYKCHIFGCTRTAGFSTLNDLSRHQRIIHPHENIPFRKDPPDFSPNSRTPFTGSYRCQVAGCTRTDGFSNLVDLYQHKKSTHPINGEEYRCPFGNCQEKEKTWSGAEDFKVHMKRIHHQRLDDDDLTGFIHRNKDDSFSWNPPVLPHSPTPHHGNIESPRLGSVHSSDSLLLIDRDEFTKGASFTTGQKRPRQFKDFMKEQETSANSSLPLSPPVASENVSFTPSPLPDINTRNDGIIPNIDPIPHLVEMKSKEVTADTVTSPVQDPFRSPIDPTSFDPTSSLDASDFVSFPRAGEPSAAQKLFHDQYAEAVPPTDSGYASVNKIPGNKNQIGVEPSANRDGQDTTALQSDDAVTEYTNASSVEPSKRDSYISDFADDLFCNISDLQPDEQGLERISTVLPDLLKAFALRLGYNAPTPMYRDVMYFVHKYRNIITDKFKVKGVQEDNYSDTPNRVPKNDDKMPLNDLMASWFQRQDLEDRPLAEDRPPEQDIDMKPQDSLESEQDYEDNRASRLGYRDFVLDTEAFRWLLARLRMEFRLVSTEPKAMEKIRQHIVSSLKSTRIFSRKAPLEELKATFELDWDVFAFFEQQEYAAAPAEAFPRVITLTGSSQDAQALTCAEYLTQTWPLTGDVVVKLIQDVLNCKPGIPKSGRFSDGTDLSAWIQSQPRPKFTLVACGSPFSLAEIGEQLAWLSAALQLSAHGNGVVCCTPFIGGSFKNSSPPQRPGMPLLTEVTYRFGFHSEQVQPSPNTTNGQCWHDMFLNPIVVNGYPIPSRVEPKTGMEIPLNMMAGLARCEHVDSFNGKIFIKGFSTLLVPTRQSGDTLFWHLVYNKDGSRISYLESAVTHAKNVSNLDLTTLRHVLGWCSEAEFYAGSAQTNHPVGSSGLLKPHEGGSLANLYVSPGRGIMGGPAFILGLKDTPAHIARNGYIPKLQWIATKFVLLWDESDKRGWLINGTSALLHIVRASLVHNSTDKFKAAFMFKPEEMTESLMPFTSDSAIDVLINPDNLAIKLYQENDGFLLLQSRIEHYYKILEKLIDHQADVAGECGTKMADKPRHYLEGWDFKDLATSRDPLYPRATTVDARGKVWIDLTRALHTVTLFGRGFGELIKPASDTCEYWAELPKQKYYVATGLSDMIQVVNNNDYYNDGHVRLSETTIWHTPTALFGSCRCRGALGREHCEPVQTLLPSTMLKSLLPRKIPIPEEGCGAIIFGHHSSFPWVWGDYGPPEQGEAAVSSKISDTDSFRDSGIGSSKRVSNTEGSTIPSRSSTPALSRMTSSCDVDATWPVATSAFDRAYNQDEYNVGIICALSKELLAVRAFFDKEHGRLDDIPGDTNHYVLGQMSRHMVVTACLPHGEYGTNPAAELASHMKRSFPNIKFCLVVGIGGGVPSAQHDIRLGDVVVSAPTGVDSGVIQWDRGKETENSAFERTGSLQGPPRFLMTAISRLASSPHRPADPLRPYLAQMERRLADAHRRLYRHPGPEPDPFGRGPRPADDPQIFYGLIASGNRVVKDAHARDRWAERGVLCFEMEAAGIMSTLPSLVIRGICDYADASKNKVWQEYAAATAAAYAKMLLDEVSPCESRHGSSLGKRRRSLKHTGWEDIPGRRQRVWDDSE